VDVDGIGTIAALGHVTRWIMEYFAPHRPGDARQGREFSILLQYHSAAFATDFATEIETT
jgi:hypothetical protein